MYLLSHLLDVTRAGLNELVQASLLLSERQHLSGQAVTLHSWRWKPTLGWQAGAPANSNEQVNS